jgi:hypothetical protein
VRDRPAGLGHHPRSHLPESHADEAFGAHGGSSRLPIRPALLPAFGLRLGGNSSCLSFFPKELLEFRARPSVLLKESVDPADLFLVAGQGAPISRIEKIQEGE